MQRVSNPVLFDGFRHLADFSQDAIYHYDIASRRFLFHNRTFRKFFQIEDRIEITATADQIIKAIHPEDRPSVRKALKQSLIAGQKEGEARYRVYHPDGAIRWLHDRWIVLHDQQGKSVAVQGFIHDNTRRKLSELQFLKAQKAEHLLYFLLIHTACCLT